MTHTSIRNVKTKSKKVYWFCIWTVRIVLFMWIEKRSEMKMDREEIYEMVIREMTETAVRARNEQSPE